MNSQTDILLVEDEPAIVDFMVRALRHASYTVRVETNGQTALAALANDPPRVMVLDLVLPILSGWAVLEQLYRHPRSIPVVVMTANPIAATQLRRYDIRQCLIKPFRMDELFGALAAAQSAPLYQ